MSGRKHCSLSWENAWPWHSGWDAKDVSITSNSCGKLTCGLYISLTRLPNFASWGYLTPHLPKGVLIIGLAPCQAYCIWSDVTHIYVCVYICFYAHSHLYVHVGMNKQTHPRRQKHTATCSMSHVPCRSNPAPRWASLTRRPRTPRNQSTSTNTTAVDGAAKTHAFVADFCVSKACGTPKRLRVVNNWKFNPGCSYFTINAWHSCRFSRCADLWLKILKYEWGL